MLQCLTLCRRKKKSSISTGFPHQNCMWSFGEGHSKVNIETVKLHISVIHFRCHSQLVCLVYTQNFWILMHQPSTRNTLSSTQIRKVALTGLKGWYRQLSVIVRTLSWAGITLAGLSRSWKLGSGSFFFSFSSFFSVSSCGGGGEQWCD